MKTLDDIDKQMIALLRADARMPLVNVAKRIGLSRSATQERLKRLENRGIVAGYTIRFAQPQSTAVRAWLWIRYRQGYRCKDVVPFVLQHAEVRLCHSVAGPIDLVVLVEARSQDHLAQIRESLATFEHIAGVETAPVLNAFHEPLTG